MKTLNKMQSLSYDFTGYFVCEGRCKKSRGQKSSDEKLLSRESDVGFV